MLARFEQACTALLHVRCRFPQLSFPGREGGWLDWSMIAVAVLRWRLADDLRPKTVFALSEAPRDRPNQREAAIPTVQILPVGSFLPDR